MRMMKTLIILSIVFSLMNIFTFAEEEEEIWIFLDDGEMVKANHPRNVISEKEIIVKDDLKVFLNGKELIFTDVKPFMARGRTMVPLRFISENLGVQINWVPEEKSVTAFKNGLFSEFSTLSNQVLLKYNGDIHWSSKIDVRPTILNGRTFVPLRAIAETFFCKVDYLNGTVFIENNERYTEEKMNETFFHDFVPLNQLKIYQSLLEKKNFTKADKELLDGLTEKVKNSRKISDYKILFEKTKEIEKRVLEEEKTKVESGSRREKEEKNTDEI